MVKKKTSPTAKGGGGLKPKLTAKQKKFVSAYLVNGNNATKAAITAGYSEKTAAAIGAENLTKPLIKQAVEAAQKKTADKFEITRDMIAAELAKIGFGNMGDFATWGQAGVALVHSDDLTEAQKSIVSEITETTSESGATVKLKLHPKVTALADLAKLLGLNKPVEVVFPANDVPPISKVEIVVIGADKKPVVKKKEEGK
jgi:phage terminase small subunit